MERESVGQANSAVPRFKRGTTIRIRRTTDLLPASRFA